jgi:hypothetical protein
VDAYLLEHSWRPFLILYYEHVHADCQPCVSLPPVWVTVAMFVALFCAYYVLDTANGPKNRFRMQRRGCPAESLGRKVHTHTHTNRVNYSYPVANVHIRTQAFPFFSYGYIPNPKTLESERGELFVDGWYAESNINARCGFE